MLLHKQGTSFTALLIVASMILTMTSVMGQIGQENSTANINTGAVLSLHSTTMLEASETQSTAEPSTTSAPAVSMAEPFSTAMPAVSITNQSATTLELAVSTTEPSTTNVRPEVITAELPTSFLRAAALTTEPYTTSVSSTTQDIQSPSTASVLMPSGETYETGSSMLPPNLSVSSEPFTSDMAHLSSDGSTNVTHTTAQSVSTSNFSNYSGSWSLTSYLNVTLSPSLETAAATSDVTSTLLTAAATSAATSAASSAATASVSSTFSAGARAPPSTSPLSPTSETGQIIIIVVPSVIGGIILVMVAAGLVIYCRRHRKLPKTRTIIPPIPPNTTPPEPVKTSKPVSLADFSEYLRNMSADSFYGFAEEYGFDLKDAGREQSTIAATMGLNRDKNRFTNILPYDISRVKLSTAGGAGRSDYINANYIPGYNGKREFIATQGPLQNTTNDFWRMVWEQQCTAIVMLTRCMEGAVDKCFRYWPCDHDPVTYGSVTVQVVDELEQQDWTFTDFNISVAGAAARHVRHFHYTAFPDHKAPPDLESMLQFTRLVRSKVTRSPGGPILVHCSAGVGRSGTYVAIDHILQHLESGGQSVDIYGIVREMRLYRMYMVQTEEQYIFIHQLVELELEQQRRAKEDHQSSSGCANEGFSGD